MTDLYQEALEALVAEKGYATVADLLMLREAVASVELDRGGDVTQAIVEVDDE